MKKSHSNSIGIKVLSLLLVLAFGATAFVVGPSMFASAPDSIPNEAVNAVKAGGNTAKAAPDSAAAGSGDKITVQKFEIDTKTIVLGEKPVVTFTAEITGVLGENDAKVVDGADTFIGYMNDKGINGDKTAGDGTYTLKLGMSHSKEEDVFYHADAKGVKSEAVKIGYYIPLTEVECKAMDDSDNRIKECMRSDDFDQMSVSERKEVMEELLYQMADKGEIKRGSIKYDEDNNHFTFEYACSVNGVVFIKGFNENLNSTPSNGYISDLGFNSADADDDLKFEEITAPTLPQNNIQNKEAESVPVGANDSYRAIILNGFENTFNRRAFYYNLQSDWNKMGLTTIVDVDVTVDDMKALTSYDVIVPAMHGNIINNTPVLSINQVVTSSTDSRYSYELSTTRSVFRAHWTTGPGYAIFPRFFTDNYSGSALNGKLIYSETCRFYGDKSISSYPDYSMANAFLNCGASAVVGYFNSVEANYSRDMMKAVVEQCFYGADISASLEYAKAEYGENDGWEGWDDGEYKYYSYPIMTSRNSKFVLREQTLLLNTLTTVNIKVRNMRQFFKFVPTTNMPIEFYSTGTKDTKAVLCDEDYDILDENDDEAEGNLNFKITYDLEANKTYFFIVYFYSVSETGSFSVMLKGNAPAAKSISNCDITVDPPSYIFDNTAKTPAVTVRDGTKTLANNTDYTVTYQNNKNVGTGKAVITGKGEYKDSVTKTFTIAYDTISQNPAKTVNITTASTMKYYKFVPGSDFNMQFYSTGDQNTYGYVYDSNLNVLAFDDNSGSGNNFAVSYSVKANTTYILGCKLNAANATGSFSICVDNAAKKQKPSLSVENKNNGLHVQWSALNGATGYKMFYKTSYAAWSSTIVNGTSFDFQTGTPGYMYYFQILPIFGSSNGTYSNVVSCTYVRNTTLQSTAYNSNGSVTVGWAVAPGANGYAIAKKRSTDKSYTYYYTSSTSFNDKNVVGGALYYYQIRPYYTNGKSAAYSDWSNTKTITTLFRPTVTNMNATAARLNINWNSIKGAQEYKVAFKRSYDSAWNFRTTISRYYNVPNPTRGATYYVQVCAISGNLAGQYSTVNSIKIL